MKILLTGATGFIGTNFILQFYKKYKIIALVRKSSDVEKIKNYCKIYYYDESIDSIENIFEKEKIEGVVHLATLYISNHDKKDIKPLINSNINFGIFLLEAMKQNPPLFFVNTLSAFEYANDNEYSPMNFYAATKHAFYDITKYYSKILPTVFVHLLLYDSYGKNDTRNKIFNLWRKNSINKEVLEMSAGEQQLDITHVNDIINAYDILIALCCNNKVVSQRIYNLENSRYTLKELAIIFEKYTNSKLNIKWGVKPYRDNEIMQPISRKQCKQLYVLPGWNPMITLKEGLNEW